MASIIINDDFLEKGECYGPALLPSIICLGSLCIASKYLFNLWQLRQRVDSLAQWLEHWIFIPEDRVRIPRSAGNFFSYASFPCYDFHVVRWELVRDRTLLSRKWLHVIKNDFIEKRECYGPALLPSIICLGSLCIASKYLFNLWQLRQRIDSLAQWLEHWIFIPEDRVRIPRSAGNVFSYASFPCYDFHVVRWGLVRDRTLLSRKWLHIIINDDFLEKGECYGPALLPSIICLGSLCIASKYLFNLWQLRQRVDSLAQWLEHCIFIPKDRVRIPRSAGNFFSYAASICYDFHVVRTGTQDFVFSDCICNRRAQSNTLWSASRKWTFENREAKARPY